MEREIVIWIAGLISTDGIAKNSNKSRGLAFAVYSSEREWLEIIKSKITTIDIISKIKSTKGITSGKKWKGFYLWFHNPRKIALLFDKYDVESFFNPRKWKIVKKGIDFYKTSGNHNNYSSQEDEIIKSNLHLSNKEIAILLNDRTSDSVAHRKGKLGLKKVILA